MTRIEPAAASSVSPFLAIPDAEWVASNNLAFAVKDRHPVNPGHTLIVPRRQITSWFDATRDERIAMMELIDVVKARIDSQNNPDGYNVGFNSGEAAGQTVKHFHVHVIPRFRGDVPDPRGGVRHVIPSRGNYLVRDVDRIMAKLGARPLAGRLAPSEAAIERFEEHIDANLPTTYRNFVARFGGTALSATCAIREPSPIGPNASVETFYGFMPPGRETYDLSAASDLAEGAPVVIPIADGVGGCQVFLFVTTPRRGQIWYNDVEGRADWSDDEFRTRYPNMSPEMRHYLEARREGTLAEKPAGLGNFYYLAPDFLEFLAACAPNEEPPVSSALPNSSLVG